MTRRIMNDQGDDDRWTRPVMNTCVVAIVCLVLLLVGLVARDWKEFVAAFAGVIW